MEGLAVLANEHEPVGVGGVGLGEFGRLVLSPSGEQVNRVGVDGDVRRLVRVLSRENSRR